MHLDYIQLPEYSIGRVYLRGGGRPCIQAVELRDPVLAGQHVFVTASSDALRTRLDRRNPRTLRELRCEIKRAPGMQAEGFRDVVNEWAHDPW